MISVPSQLRAYNIEIFFQKIQQLLDVDPL